MTGPQELDSSRSDPPDHRRVIAYSLAVLSFFALGFVVYRDDPSDPGAFTKLSDHGREGYQLWRQQNCHTCHQLYGFGGYLGPDLTHVTRRVTGDDFYLILHAGVGPMPRIGVDEEQAEHLYTFLKEMDKSGWSYPGAGVERPATPTWDEVFADLGGAASKDAAAVAPGVAVFNAANCKDCHQPLRLGRLAAPDLTRVFDRLGAERIMDTLHRGKGNMPAASSLEGDANKTRDLLTLLRVLGERRHHLRDKFIPRVGGGGAGDTGLPWWRFDGGAPAHKETAP